MFALQYADLAELNKQGRPFSCDKCERDPQSKGRRTSIARIRRCRENRWDFTEKDGASFPIQLHPGGPTFGFCPAKVLRDDQHTGMIFKTLMAILETGTWPDAGGLNDQEFFWIDLVGTFGPLKKSLEFNEKFNIVAKSLKGGEKSQIKKPSNVRRP